jgi:uncharacterized membrane protein YhhN
VTTLAWVALALAAVFAVADWVSRARDDQRLEYVAKPATLVALIVVALAIDPQHDGTRAWFVAALVFSLAGDVFLMLPSDQFVAGLASFLVAHVCYVVGLWLHPPEALAVVVAAVVVAAAIVPVAGRIIGALKRGHGGEHRDLVAPVAAYIAVISVMVISAIASGNVAAAAGAVLFAGSDSMIAWSRFVRPFRAASVAIMVTYHLGQALLVLSLLATSHWAT